MKIIILTLSLLLLTNFSFSQIKKRDLNGIWKTENDNELFSKTDTIKFYRSIKNCVQIKWTFENNHFEVNEINKCVEPPTYTLNVAKEKMRLKRRDFGQILEYYQDKSLIDKFRIIELNNNNKPKLKLMRFDKLSEQKLYKYVDSLILKVLKYDPNKKESDTNGIKISGSNQHAKITIRNSNPEPLVVVNGYPLKDREPLKELLLVETYGITYLTKEQSASIYGLEAINGVVVLQASEKRFKKIWKKYGW